MVRLLIACVLGLGIFGLIGWQFELFSPGDSKSIAAKSDKKAKIQRNLGEDLFPAEKIKVGLTQAVERKRDPVILTGNLAAIYKPDIATQIAGQLLYVGEDVPEGAMQLAGVAAFLAAPFDFARINQGSRKIVQPYRLLNDGDSVYADQILAMVDPAKALGEMQMKSVKISAAEADSRGADAIAQEAEIKLRTADQQLRTNSIAMEEWRSAKLTKEKMYLDSISKKEQVNQARIEETMSRIIYHQHEVRNKIPSHISVIQRIYHQRGEAVKELEPVMQLLSLDPLGADAQIDGEYSQRIFPGMLVTVEPTIVVSPDKIYRGHVSAVNCLAVTKDRQNPLIVSGGDDGTVFIWKRFEERAIREFKHNDPVKALVVSPLGAPDNLLLTGFSDGTIRLYDLAIKDNDKALVKESRKYDVAITALAFSPDGKYFASGAADGSIVLWTTETLEPVFAFDDKHGVDDPHHGPVTALRFTPQCKLVSASMDKTLQVWSLKEKGAGLEYLPLTGRNGSIGQIDVSSDGRWLLFDQGKTLQIRAVADGRIINTFQNPGGVIPFETLALFSPDNSMVLTAGASEGRLQLWHVPTGNTRGFEIRQFATRERVPVSCAAFAPLMDYQKEGTFAVSANMDGQIYLWPLPSAEEVANHPIRDLPLQFADGGLNPSTRQRNIRVRVPNPPSEQHPKGRLEPGRPVTIVIE